MALTNQIRYFKVVADADGQPVSGLLHSDFGAAYIVQGGTKTILTPETITTLGTYQAPTSASHIRIREVEAVAPTIGIYEVHFHNTQLAGGSKLWLFLWAEESTVEPLEIDLSLYTLAVDVLKSMFKGNTVYFVRTTGSDSNDGLTPSTAFLTVKKFCDVSSAKDVCNIGPGVFDEGTNRLAFKSGQYIFGANKNRTEIRSQVIGASAGAMLDLSGTDGVVIEDLYLNANFSGNNGQLCIGSKSADSAGWTNLTCRRVKMFGNIDVIQLTRTDLLCTGKFYECELIGGFDTIATSSLDGSLLEFYDCTAVADVLLLPAGYTTGSVRARCIVAGAGTTVRWHRGEMTAQNGSTQSSCVLVTTGVAEIYDVLKFTSSGGSTPYDLENQNGTLKTAGSAYDPAKTSGTITAAATATDLKKIVNPAADVNLSGTTIKNASDVAATLTAGVVNLKKNTAFNYFKFYMETNGGSAATGKTVTAKRSLDNAAFASCANSVSEISDGWYKINLAATDLNADSIGLMFTAPGCKARPIMVVTQVGA